MTPKWFLQSRIMWIAILTGLAGAGNYLTGAVTDPATLSIVLTVVAVLTAVLRSMTKAPVTLKAPMNEPN